MGHERSAGRYTPRLRRCRSIDQLAVVLRVPGVLVDDGRAVITADVGGATCIDVETRGCRPTGVAGELHEQLVRERGLPRLRSTTTSGLGTRICKESQEEKRGLPTTCLSTASWTRLENSLHTQRGGFLLTERLIRSRDCRCSPSTLVKLVLVRPRFEMLLLIDCRLTQVLQVLSRQGRTARCHGRHHILNARSHGAVDTRCCQRTRTGHTGRPSTH